MPPGPRPKGPDYSGAARRRVKKEKGRIEEDSPSWDAHTMGNLKGENKGEHFGLSERARQSSLPKGRERRDRGVEPDDTPADVSRKRKAAGQSDPFSKIGKMPKGLQEAARRRMGRSKAS